MAVATSAPTETVRLVLGSLPRAGLLRIRVDISMAIRSEPNPGAFPKTAAPLGEPSANCVVVEDGLAGLAAARAEGMATLALTTTMTRKELLPMADRACDTLTGVEPVALRELIAKRNAGGGGTA
ncbi:MAG: hypothetical protein LBJ46_03415 [Planctomycetota bacterium]|jgi:sugar-phosphatase|nr:hypothetical protein [Planctomycetota bacterium]